MYNLISDGPLFIFRLGKDCDTFLNTRMIVHYLSVLVSTGTTTSLSITVMCINYQAFTITKHLQFLYGLRALT